MNAPPDPHAPTPGTENQIDYDAIEKLEELASIPGVGGFLWIGALDADGVAQAGDRFDPRTVLALVRKARQRDAAEKETEAQIAEWQADREGLTPKGATDRAFANMIHGAEIALNALRKA